MVGRNDWPLYIVCFLNEAFYGGDIIGEGPFHFYTQIHPICEEFAYYSSRSHLWPAFENEMSEHLLTSLCLPESAEDAEPKPFEKSETGHPISSTQAIESIWLYLLNKCKDTLRSGKNFLNQKTFYGLHFAGCC